MNIRVYGININGTFFYDLIYIHTLSNTSSHYLQALPVVNPVNLGPE
jgi:hypothetical protein